MPSLFTAVHRRFLESHRVAHLATAGAEGMPHVVPVCFAFDGKCIYIAIDEKPKRVAGSRLKRLRNIAENSQVALVVDDYSDDWSRLAWLMVRGRAEVVLAGRERAEALRSLRAKYPRYQAMALEDLPLLVITPDRITAWGKVT